MEENEEIDAREGVKQGAGASEMEENREIDAEGTGKQGIKAKGIKIRGTKAK